MRKNDVLKLMFWVSFMVAFVAFLYLAGEDPLNKLTTAEFVKQKIIAFVIFCVSTYMAGAFFKPTLAVSRIYAIITIILVTVNKRNSKFGRKARFLYLLRDECEDVRDFYDELRYRYIVNAKRKRISEAKARINKRANDTFCENSEECPKKGNSTVINFNKFDFEAINKYM